MARVTLTTRVAALESRFDQFESKLDQVLAALTPKAPVTPVTPEAPVKAKKAKVTQTPVTPATPAPVTGGRVAVLSESVTLGSVVKFDSSAVHNARLDKSTETLTGDGVTKAFGSVIVGTLVGHGSGKVTRAGYRVFTVKTTQGYCWVKMNSAIKITGTDAEWLKGRKSA
jgi:hypothetical protein